MPLLLQSVIFQVHVNSVNQQVTQVIFFAQGVTAIINLQSVEQTVRIGLLKIVLSCAKEQCSGRLPQTKNHKIHFSLKMASVGLNYGAFCTGTQLACLSSTRCIAFSRALPNFTSEMFSSSQLPMLRLSLHLWWHLNICSHRQH